MGLDVDRIMRRKSRLSKALGLAVMVCVVSACGVKRTELSCDTNFPKATPANLAVNIYIDGTPSMKGFTASSEGTYAKVIEALRTTMTLDEPVTLAGETGKFARSPLFFRLGKNAGTGEQIKEISEAEYREAQFADFYDGSSAKFPPLEVTNLDAAIAPIPDGNGLTVILTDLYQGEDNIKAVLQALKVVLDQSPEQSVGLVGIPSDFDGIVYTEGLRNSSQFQYKGNHPLYALFIGRLDDVHFYVDKLVETVGSQADTQAVVFSSHQFYSRPVMLAPQSQSELAADPSLTEARRQTSIPAEAMKVGSTAITFGGDAIQPLQFRAASTGSVVLPGIASLAPLSHVLPLSDIAATVTTTSSAGANPFESEINANIVTFGGRTLTGNTLTVNPQFDLANMNKADIYFIKASLTPSGGLSSQQWWSDWNATTAEKEGSKTHNLESFTKQLRAMTNTRIDQGSPELGKLCYVVQEQ